MIFKIKKRNIEGFTLSEVLITILIIGVIAALTVPIIQNVIFQAEQKSQFKKAYTTLFNAILAVKADQGRMMKCYYPLPSGGYISTECSSFKTEFEKKLNVIKKCTTNAYSNGCIEDIRGGDTIVRAPGFNFGIGACPGMTETLIKNNTTAWVLADGSTIMMYTPYVPIFWIDINGKKLPNKWGYDIFSFVFKSDGEIIKLNPDICGMVEVGGTSTAKMLINQ